jgi:acetate kinase
MPSSLLTINGGSSSVKFALYRAGRPPAKVLGGNVERISGGASEAAEQLLGVLGDRVGATPIAGIGHRVVHGGPGLLEHQLITPAVFDGLRKTVPIDQAHLPHEIALIEAMQRQYPGVPQVACFDTAFHRQMPRVAQLLPIPRRYDRQGVRRFGFHGISYTYLMEELARIDAPAAKGRVILAHLGSGASMAAVRGGRPVDTTMGFTPTAGLVMGTRPGDLDPGVLAYLSRIEKWSAEDMDDFINRRCGLIGVSETSNDVRDLIARRATDVRAAEAIELFCYQARRWVGSLASSMVGLETLVFSGGIGEHSAPVRAEICAGLEFLGVKIDGARNAATAGVISSDDSAVSVRVIATNEELVIAKTVCGLLKLIE